MSSLVRKIYIKDNQPLPIKTYYFLLIYKSKLKSMNGQENKSQMIMARAIIPIFFSSMTNTSKKIAFMFQEKLESEGFLATVTNIGDADKEEFLELTGPAVFFMSTYGNGGSPADGEQFMEWLKKLEKKNFFENIQFAVMGFGNRSFQHFCGNAKSFKQCLQGNGAREIVQMVLCNSASTDQQAAVKFPQWSNNLIQKLKEKYEIKQMNVGELLQKFKIIASQQHLADDHWEKDLQEWESKLGKQFLAYHKSFKADVIDIKQIRTQNDGRSTLWVRMKKPQGLTIQPGCNINVYPQNVRKQGEKALAGSLRIQTFKKTSKVAYPPMSLERLWKISNFNQIADSNLVKYALTMSNASEEVKSKYAELLKNREQYEKNPVRCWQLYEELNPGLDFIVKLGINTVRPYTLSSWDPSENTIDLVVAIEPLGLTSKYLTSLPTYLKVRPSVSSFYVPQGRPIVMIANGTGIAPFRSLTQYLVNHPSQLPQLYLYFGIQSKEVDYYFKQQWEQLQKQGKIKLRIAESRADPSKKVYVQDLLKEDRQFMTKHLFDNKGVVFICGSAPMAKSIDSELFQAVKKVQKIPFKAFKMFTELSKNKTIVKEVFD